MADNPSVDPGPTPSIPVAGDDVGGAVYQRVKLRAADDGVAGSDVSAANPLPVTDALTEAGVGGVADVAYVSGSGSLVALLKGIFAKLPALVGGRLSVDASAVAVPVTDNAGSLTVDAPVGTPLAVRLSDGSAFQQATRVDNQAFTDNASNITPGGYLFDEVAGTALTENDAAAARIDSKRAQVMVIEDETTRGQRQTVNAAKEALVRQPAATTGAAPTAFTSTTSAQIFASNALRKLFTVYNNSDQILYLMLASAAVSATSYHVKVIPNSFFSTSDYSGEIRGIMAATINTGQVNPGEFT